MNELSEKHIPASYQPLAGRKVLVVGLARSGEAAARLLLLHGCRVTVNDRREMSEVQQESLALERLGASLVFGGHPQSLLDQKPDFIVKNPGIPYSVPLIEAAVSLDIPIYTEIEVASWFTDSPIIAITGSNGKTTTTTLVGEMLCASSLNPVVAGNIGNVLSGVVMTVQPSQPIVLEVSSFQLMGTETVHPRVAALLNLYPAHLDYHGTFEAYAAAKWRLFRNMGPGDTVVLNYDQSVIRDRAADVRADILWFSTESAVPQGVFVHEGAIVLRRAGVDTTVLPVSEVALKGAHNLQNALCATAMAFSAGASLSGVAAALTTFGGVEHRLEFVKTVRGVQFYNDSKSTNPTAALQALRSFDKGIVWIAGGLNRGDDLSVLLPDVSHRVKAAVLLGESADRLAAAVREAGVLQVIRAEDLDEAVQSAMAIAVAGDTVLLSPACASWDMFASFEERGRIFKEAVHRL